MNKTSTQVNSFCASCEAPEIECLCQYTVRVSDSDAGLCIIHLDSSEILSESDAPGVGVVTLPQQPQREPSGEPFPWLQLLNAACLGAWLGVVHLLALARLLNL